MMKIALFICLLWTAAEPVSAADHTMSAAEMKLFSLVERHKEQTRAELKLDPILCVVARSRAADMVARKYFSHTNRDGKGANLLVEEASYWLPDFYSELKNANSIESLASGAMTPARIVGMWKNSPMHRAHVFATNPFYREQTRIGIGIARNPKTGSSIFVFISAPENLNPSPSYWMLRNSAGVAITSTGTPP